MKRDLDKQRWIQTKVKHRADLNVRYKPSFFNRLRRSIISLNVNGPAKVMSVDEWNDHYSKSDTSDYSYSFKE